MYFTTLRRVYPAERNSDNSRQLPALRGTQAQPTLPMKTRLAGASPVLQTFVPLLSVAAALFIFTASDVRAQITVGSDGPDETDSTDYSGAQTLTKIGSNTVTMTGNNSYTGATTVQEGGLTVDTPGTLTGNTPLTVANGSNNAVFTIETGTANVRDLRVGNSTGAGVVVVNGGTMNSGGEMWFGTSPTNDAYGALIINDGTVNSASWVAPGRGTVAGSASSRGLILVNGGTLNVNGGNLAIGATALNRNAMSVMAVSNGTVNVRNGIFVGENLSGFLDISGGSVVTGTNNGVRIKAGGSGTGILNLRGGTLSAGFIQAGTGGTSILNLDGGVLNASMSTNGFMQGITSAFIYSGGATIDSGTNNITIAQALAAPTGNGLTSIAFTGGSDYVAPPIVQITGGGGSGASALAQIDANGNLTNILITSAGSGYTSAPTVTIVGGGGSGATNILANIAANAAGGGLTKLGAGTMILSGSNTYAGGTLISAGTLQVGTNGTSGSLGTGDVTNNGALIFNRSGDLLVSGAISGSGTIEQAGSGVTVLSGAGSYTNPVIISGGVLQFATTSSLFGGNTADWTESNIIVRSNGTLGLSVGGGGEFAQADIDTILANLDGSVTTGGLLAGSAIAFGTDNAPGGNFTLTNAILDTTGSGGGSVGLGKLGAGTMTLTTDQTYSGTTTIYAGTLSLGDGGTAGSISNTANVVANGTLQFNRSAAIEFDKVISGTGGILQSGAGSVTLTADNTYRGSTVIQSNTTLQVGNGGMTGSLGTGASGGALFLIPGPITNNGALIFNRAGLLTNGGAITGTGSLTMTGTGKVVLTGNRSYAGPTAVNSGTLEIIGGYINTGSTNAAYTVTNGATLQIAFNNVNASPYGAENIKVYGDGTNATTGLYFRGGTLWNATKQIELLGGPTIIRSYETNRGMVGLGSWAYEGLTVSSNASGSVTDAGIEFVTRGYGAVVRTTAGANNATGDLVIEGRLNVGFSINQGQFVKKGNGSVLIMGAGTTTNNWVVIEQGLLIAGTEGVLGDHARLDVASAGTFKMNGFDQTARLLNGSGRIMNDSATAATLTVNQTNKYSDDNTNTVFSGVIGGTNANEQNLSLVKNGGGTLTLSGNNNYSGSTFIGSGPLQIGAGGASGALGTGAVTNNGSLIVNRNNDYALSNSIAGTGSFEQAGPGRTMLSGTNTYDGTTTVGAGTLQFAKAASLYNGAAGEWTKANITVRSNAAVIFNVGGAGEFDQSQINTLMANLGGTVNSNGLMGGSSLGFDTANDPDGNFIISNAIADTTGTGGGSIGLAKYGANTLTLAVNNGYTGGTTIYGGTLAVGTGGTTGSISGNVDNRGTLLFNRSDNTTFTGEVSGTGSLVNAGAGTTTLTGSNTYTGTTTISAGGLAIGGSGVLGGGNYSANITNIGSFSYNSSANQTLRGTFSGGGAINKDGTGSLTLASIPNYGGSTLNISNGTTVVTGNRFGAEIGLSAINVVGSNAVLQTTTHALGGYGKPVPAIAITNGTWNLRNEQYVNSLTLDQGTVTGPGEIRSDKSFSVLVTNGTSTWSAPLNLVSRDGFFNVVSNATLQMSGRILGSPGLVKNGEGTMVLNATDSTYSGYTTISNGVLQAGTSGAMPSNSIVRVQGGAFDPNGTTNTLRGLVLYNVTNGLKAGEKITTTVANDESFQLGSASNNVTAYNMTGGEFTLAAGNLQNGYYGKSTLNQSGGTLSVNQGFFVLGRMAGGEGIYNLTGGSAVQAEAGKTMNIGESGRGEMNVSGTGTLTAAGTIRIGIGAASSGALNILDGGTVNAPRIEFGAGTNNSLNFNRSDSLSFTSPITGAGYVTKTGTGTVTFTTNNSYTRGTTVNGGTLVALGLANNSNNTITANSGGTFVFNRNDTFGSHGATVLTPIVINDGGTVRNNGNFFNALGPVALNGGTLQSIGSVAGTGSPDGRSFALKGDVTVGGSNTSTIAGPGIVLGAAAVTGTTFNVADGAAAVDLRVTAGLANGPAPNWFATPQASSLTKTGDGNMVLEGTNTYSGNTTVGAGTLTVGGAGQLGAGNYNGDMVISNGATFVQASSANQTLGGVISGGGNLVKSSTGTLTLDGLENTYTGTTTIDGGTLLLNVNHSGAGDYTVNSGGTLGGIGATTADVTVNSGGTIAPGNSPGQLTVGNFTLNTGGTLNIFLSGGVSSLLQVNGDVNLLGGGVDFTTLTTPLTASLYTFVQYTGSLTGTFGFTNNLPTGYELVYGDDQTIFLAQTNVAYPVSPVFKGTNAVITGGTLPFEVAVYNNDATNVVFWATNGSNTTGGFGDTPLAVDDSTNVAGLTWTGTNVGANQSGDFTVTFSNGVGTNQTTNVAVSVSVYDHAAGSLVTNAITNLDAIVGYTGSLNASILATNAAGFRAPLGTTSTSTNGNLVVTDVADVDPENSDYLLFALTGQGAGAFTNDVTVVFRDSSALSGASTNLGTTNVTVTGTIYNHALGSVSATNLGFAPVHAGYAGPLTTTNSITVSNASGLYVDLGVANNNTDAFIDLAAVTGLTNGTSTNLSATMDAGRGVGAFTNVVTLTFYDDSTLLGASTNLGTTNILITGLVYSGQGVWTAASGGNWTNFSNWTADGGVPGIDGPLSVNDTAFFGTNGNGPVTLDTNAALLAVTFSNTNSYTIEGSGTLTLAASGPTDPSITSQAGTHTISNAIAATGNLLLDTTNNAGLVLNGVISGAASLVKDGAGTAFLGAANTYSGTTTVGAGTLVGTVAGAFSTNTIIVGADDTNSAALLVDVSNGGFTVSNAITVVPNPGTSTIGTLALGTTGWATCAGPIELQENVILASAAAATPGDTVNNRTDFSGGITGTGDVTIQSATNSRVIFMDAENTFAGNVFITPESTLQLSDGTPNGNSLIPDAANVNIGTNAFLSLAKGNNSETIAGLTGAGTVQSVSGTNTLVVGSGDASSAFSGNMQDNGGVLAFEKSGSGTFTFTGTGSYSGGTYVSGGVMNVEGSGSISGTKELWVYNNDSTLNISNGGTVSATNALIGQGGSTGSQINVTGATSSLSVSDTLNVGYDGTNNALNVSEGTVAAGSLWIGGVATAAGSTVNLTDTASLVVSNSLIIGYAGTGSSLNVLGGSQASVTGTSDVIMGYEATSTGNSLLVSGVGSTFSSPSNKTLYVGFDGASNSLVVEDGGTLVTGNARIGGGTNPVTGADSDGNAVTVDGGGAGGASWAVNGTLQVGSQGDNNTLNITNGGVVTATGNIWVGYTNANNSNNLVYITGENSKLETTGGDLIIGPNFGADNRVVVADGGGVVADLIEMPNGKLQIGDGGDAGIVSAALIFSTNGGGVVEFNHTNAPYNFDPIMAGTVSVLHSGSGTTVLLGDNTYSGTTTIEDGILQIGDGGITGSLGTGDVTNNATLVFNRGDAITASNVIAGTGELIQRGTGTTTLTGNSTYTGGTTVEAGQLNLAGLLANDSNNILTVKSNAVVSFDRNDVFGIHSDAINAPVVIEAGGKLQNGGAYYNGLGPVTLQGGTIEATATESAGYSFSFEGDVMVDGGANTSTIAGPGIALGAVTKNSVEFDVRNGAADVDLMVSAVLVDGPSAVYATPQPSSLIKSGAGKMVMSGANTYSGGTTIKAGTIVAQSQTALGAGPVQLLGGTLELQSQLDIASLFWDGGAGATQIAIANPAAGHFVNVASPITISNGINTFNLTGAALPGPVKLLAAPGVSTNSLALFGVQGVDTNTYQLAYIGDELWLTLIAPPVPPVPPAPSYPNFTQFALTPNQTQVAQALNQWVASGATGDRATVLNALTNSGDYPGAFEQMMPSQYSSLPSMAFNVVNALNSSMFQQLWVIRVNGRGFSSTLATNPMQAEMGGTDDMGVFAINPSKETKWSSFVDGNGVFANASSTGSVQNYRSQSGGVSTGAAYSWNDAFATGVYVGYQGLQAEYNNGRTIDNAVRFGVFGTYDLDDFYINGLVGGAYHGYTVNRNINFGGLNRTATGRPGAGEFDLALGTGYDFDIGNFSWGPFTTMQYTYLGMQGFSETGAGALNLDVSPYDSSSLLYTLGAQAAYNWKVAKNVIITPTAFAGWQHEFLQNGYTINSTFATGGPAAPFNYNTASPARDNFYGGVGVTVGVGESWQATFIYSSFVGGQNQNSQNLYLGLGYKF